MASPQLTEVGGLGPGSVAVAVEPETARWSCAKGVRQSAIARPCVGQSRPGCNRGLPGPLQGIAAEAHGGRLANAG